MMSRKLIVALAASLAVGGAASAQDWDGFYVGAMAGSAQFSTLIDASGYLVDYSDSQFLVGGLAGYNYQIGQYVVGVEGDYQSGSGIDPVEPNVDNFLWAGPLSVATIRARVGVVNGNVLIYGTGGYASGTVMTAQEAVFNPSDYEEASAPISGLVFGGGAEIMFKDGWSARGEYRVYQFNDTDVIVMPSPYVGRTLNDIGYSEILLSVIRHF